MGNILLKKHLSVVEKGNLTLDEHIKKLEDARKKIKEGFNEWLIALREAYVQLPEGTFQNELGVRLGMRKSILSKWIQIISSNYLMNNRNDLPSTMSGLYTFTLIEKKYKEWYGDNHHSMLNQLFKKNYINPNTEHLTLENILQDIKNLIRENDQDKRENAILSLSNSKLANNSQCKSLDEHLKDNVRFRSFVVIPSEKQISRWSDDGYFAHDISEEFPLHDLRTPSMKLSVSCLIKIRMRNIDTGLKLLNAWGFSYRDIAVPPTEKKYTILDNSYVLLRGERGQRKNIPLKVFKSFETNDILDFAEKLSASPNILVFENSNRKGWSSIPKEQ
jgi:hypothetical protein